MKKIFLLFGSFLTFVVMAGFGASSVHAATIHVTTTGDSSMDDTTCSLEEAVSAAETNTSAGGCEAGDPGKDLVDLTGVSGEIAMTYGEFVLTESLEVVGPGMDILTLKGLNHSQRLFNLAENGIQELVISDLTIEEFGALNNLDDFGGAIFVKADDILDLTNVGLLKNKAARGGALYNLGGTVKLENTFFMGNVADFGGAILNEGNLNIASSRFLTNSATAVGGGLVNAKGNAGIDASVFENNKAGQLGGAIANEAGTMEIFSSSVLGNTSESAAAIFNYGILTSTNTTISGNSASHYAGGIYNDIGGSLMLVHVTLASNSANTSGQAADALGAGLYQVEASDIIQLQNSILASNTHSGITDDCYATIISSGVNLFTSGTGCTGVDPTKDLVEIDPLLKNLSLKDPGKTEVMALKEESPARDASTTQASLVDQRGVARPQGSAHDLGAVEFSEAFDLPPVVDPPSEPSNPGSSAPGGSDISAQESGNPESSDSEESPGNQDQPASNDSSDNGTTDEEFNGGGTGEEGDAPESLDQAQEYTGAGSTPNLDPFTDISGNFAESEIVKLYNDCKVAGFTDASGKLLYQFRPSVKITRYDLITILVKCRFGEQQALPADAPKPFPDVAGNHYAAPYVAKAKAEGIVSGFKDGNFYGENNATRSEAAKMIILTWFEQKDVDASPKQIGKCTDLGSGPDAWYLGYWNFALDKGIMSGYMKDGKPLNQCRPLNDVTRAETAKIVVKTKELAKL